jgi:ATP-dependent RNA helicase RhlE
MTFRDLGLSAALLRALDDQGYQTPTPVQREAIPAVLTGGDIMAAAQTGTGKTAGFTLPILQRLMQEEPRPGARPIRALVITPTRELAAQVQQSVKTYGRHLPLRSATVFGGVGMQPQVATLKRGVDILVATPGRLLDHLQRRTVDLSQVRTLVLDEADRMLDMGFVNDIRKIISAVPTRRQTLMFSATFSDEITRLAQSMLTRPTRIEVAARNSAAETVTQRVHPVGRNDKKQVLSHLIRSGDWQQVLVFTRTKRGADRLATQLERDGLAATAIHGNKSQGARTRALGQFKQGGVRILVATDIAARGLDIDQLPHVVNYDLPEVPEDYLHRIGRTGRAGRGGEAISLVSSDDRGLLQGIERMMRRTIHSETVPGHEPDPFEATADAKQRGRGAGPKSPRQGVPDRKQRAQPGNRNRRRHGNPPRGTASANRTR